MTKIESKAFYPALEGFRGVAILLVLLSHFIIVFYVPSLMFLKLGYLGVNFFFVLSGFLITESLIVSINNEERSILSNFYYKRTLRIFPIFYLSIFILFFILNSETFNRVLPWAFTYTYNVGSLWFGVDSKYLSHFWSLCVEEQFYLAWPLLLITVHKKNHIFIFLGAIFFAVVIKFSYVYFGMFNFQDVVHASTPASVDALATGGLLAYLKQSKPHFLKRILFANTWVPLFLILVFWTLTYFFSDQSFFHLVAGRMWTALIAFYFVGWGALNKDGFSVEVLKNGVLRFLGKISYGLYVYHWILYFLFIDTFDLYWSKISVNLGILGFQKWLFSFLFFTMLTFIVATLSFYLIERPLLRLKNKRFNVMESTIPSE